MCRESALTLRLRKKKPLSLAQVGCILSPETLLAGDSQRLLASTDFFWVERNLGSDDGADWFAFWNCGHEPVLFVTAAQEFLLGQKLVLHVKLATEQDEMLFPEVASSGRRSPACFRALCGSRRTRLPCHHECRWQFAAAVPWIPSYSSACEEAKVRLPSPSLVHPSGKRTDLDYCPLLFPF
jgi:hypothetical protein